MPHRKHTFRSITPSKRRCTRSASRNELLASILTILVQNDWLVLNELSALEQTNHTNRILFKEDHLWKVLFSNTLQDLPASTIYSFYHELENISNFRSIFHDPRAWIFAEATRVRSLPKWSRVAHYGHMCSRCESIATTSPQTAFEIFQGKVDSIQIRTEYRYVHKQLTIDPIFQEDIEMTVLGPRGDESVVRIGKLCQVCFEEFVGNGTVQQDEYDRFRGGTTLFDYLFREIMILPPPSSKICILEYHHNDHNDPLMSWQDAHEEVDPDDVAVVIAYALIHPDCRCEALNTGAIHQDCTPLPAFGKRGYKALAYALGLNTTLMIFDMEHLHCESANPFRCYCMDCDKRDKDPSNGLFAKAIKFNENSALESLHLPEELFGDSRRERMDTTIRIRAWLRRQGLR